MKGIAMVSLAVAILAAPTVAQAQDVTILVAPADTPAEASATKQADGKTILAERKLFKAFDLAAVKLTECKTCKVTIKVAGGPQVGKGKVGQWTFPEVIAPGATLHLLGGWDDKFAKRAPMTNPTVLVTSTPRSGPILAFEGRKHALTELQLSGFVLDAAPGNKYDAKTNSLLKGSSSTFAMMAFGYLTVKRLIISDNVFMNSAHTVGAPLVRPADEHSEVIVRNNLFLNNVFCWQVVGSGNKYTLERYVFEGNSFILNFPFNPDATTSNPGALEIGNTYSAKVVDITGNLFAHNVGGAIFMQWDDKAGPPITIKNNLFWQNGALFAGKGDGKGAIVGKFNRSGVYGSYTADEAADDFSWTIKGNVVEDPDMTVPVLDLKAVTYEKPKRPEAPTEAAEEDFFGNTKAEIIMDEDVQMGDFAVDGKIKNFAPRMPFNIETFPFPKSARAKKYGASAERVK
jgi:hypothetical protein